LQDFLLLEDAGGYTTLAPKKRTRMKRMLRLPAPFQAWIFTHRKKTRPTTGGSVKAGIYTD